MILKGKVVQEFNTVQFEVWIRSAVVGFYWLMPVPSPHMPFPNPHVIFASVFKLLVVLFIEG